VKLGMYVQALAEGMAEEADRLDLPLFTLDQETPWVDLMEPLLERIINAEHWRLKRSLEIHRRFTDLVLDGQGVNEICRTLAELLDSGVAVEDASFHLLAHAGGSNNDPHRRETIARHGTPPRVLYDPQIQRTLREVEAKRGPVKVPAFPHLGMSRERLIAPILAANQVLGYISILDHPPHNEELAFMAIEQAALVLALSIAKERELSEVEGRVRGEFLEDLLHGTYGDEAAAQRRARHVGYPLHGSHIVLLVDIDDFRGFNRARQISEDAIQALKREFLRRVTAVVRMSYQRALVQGRSDQVVALLPLGTEVGDHQARSHALGLQVQHAIAEWKPGFTVSVGFSAPIEAPTGVEGALREVTSVMESLARFKRWAQVVALLPLGTEIGDHQARSHALGLQVQQAIGEWKPGFTISVGFSAPIEAPNGVESALREVTSVMESLARFKRWAQVVAVPELGLTGLLAAVSDERLVDYSRRHLGPLIEHDAARKGALVATLRAYLETGEQQHAAQRLRVHPNTLRYRLDRIREITGLDLEDPETRLNLSVALRVQALLGM